MNLSELLDHWKIAENPFRGEEARHDAVFARMTGGEGDGRLAAFHSDFDKVLGELDRPSTAVLFGEKGSGKTAIRMQIAERVAAHNAEHANDKVFLIGYDDLNAQLDRLHAGTGKKDPLKTFEQIRLVDHMDAILSAGVRRIVDAVLTGGNEQIPRDATRRLRQMRGPGRRELLLLQGVYDRGSDAHERTRRLARKLRLTKPLGVQLWRAAAWLGWVLPVGVVAAFFWRHAWAWDADPSDVWTYGFFGAVALWALLVLKRGAWDRLMRASLARRVARQLRMIDRPDASWARSLEYVPRVSRSSAVLPLTDSDEQRYAMMDRLRRVTRAMGYSGVMVVVDRVDEPTLVRGDPDRMRAIVWPLFNNKFLQQDGVGIKLLLPIELRHSLFRESSAFFQEARLDKQNLVERLSWTGAMLYDLCDARLQACRDGGAEPLALLALFDEDVTRQDIVDALDQMHQPRDAFKFLYRCLTEHCSNVTKEDGSWRIPRLVLETVRKSESDRVQQLYRGIRPA